MPVIPSEGELSLDAVAEILASAPEELGISSKCEVRSFLVYVDGEWFNHCTVLRAGVEASETSEEVRPIVAGRIQVVAAMQPARAFKGAGALLEALSTWGVVLPADHVKAMREGRYGRRVVRRPWDFQDKANVYHHPSRGPWGEGPCWVIEVYDKTKENRSRVTPRGPFRHAETHFYAEDLGGAVEQWIGDPNARDSTSVQDSYRVVIPDNRGVIRNLERRGDDLHITVEGKDVAALSCAITTGYQRSGQTRSQRALENGLAVFSLPETVPRVELYIFDDSEVWCDSYWEDTDHKPWGKAIAIPSQREGPVQAAAYAYLDSPGFALAFPDAHAKWAEAEQLLSDPDSARQLTTIGHLCREALQLFTTALVQRMDLGDVDPDPGHTVARVRAALEKVRDRTSATVLSVVDALLQYWGSVSDLVQRQEHGAQKEGAPLGWEDARRVVLHTALVMHEVELVTRDGGR